MIISILLEPTGFANQPVFPVAHAHRRPNSASIPASAALPHAAAVPAPTSV